MSLNLAVNSLVSLGLGAGDIAVIYGASRKAGTWMKAQWNDRALLDFLQVEKTDVIRRKGVINITALNARWGKTLTILTNGHKVSHQDPGKKAVIPNNDDFTWLMTMMVVCLDAAASAKTVERVIKEFLVAVLGDLFHPEYSDYFDRELPFHIQGWRSNGNVRGMFRKPQDLWSRLAAEKKHPSGFVPHTDAAELIRMLAWITAGVARDYTTTSSDAYCLAYLLSDIGLDLLKIDSPEQPLDLSTVDENCFVVRLSDAPYQSPMLKISPQRCGMRVPLDSMEEVVSLWPGKETDTNKRRMIFKDGMEAAKGVELNACTDQLGNYRPGILTYRLVAEKPGRVSNGGFRLAERYLLAPTEKGACALNNLLNETWKLQPDASFAMALLLWQDDLSAIEEPYLGDFQSFLMGYYYAVLRPLLDISQLAMKEVFGSWGWNDLGLFKMVRSLTRVKISQESQGKEPIYWKHDILKMVAYLFAGSELEQIRQIDHRTIGVLGKLCVLHASLLGGAHLPEKNSELHVLDIDASCIPSTALGIVRPGKQPECIKSTSVAPLLEVNEDTLRTIARQSKKVLDFTSHIEPDWDFDTQTCLVTYRYGGRLIHRIDPKLSEMAILNWSLSIWQDSTTNQSHEENGNPELPRAHSAGLEDFFGGRVISSSGPPNGSRKPPILIDTTRLPKAKTCIASMYHNLNNRYDGRLQDGYSTETRRLPTWIENRSGAVIVDFDQDDWAVLF